MDINSIQTMPTMTTDQVDQLLSGNYIYQQYHKRWKFLLNSFMGGLEYKNGHYLTRYQLETDGEYAARIDSTPLDNQCASIVSVYNSFLFREEPDREYGSIANLPELQDFIDDVDFDGRNIDQFMLEVATWSEVFGHTWIIVSKPNINALTKADELAVNLRPYLSIISPLTVLDWKWERDETGRYKLCFLRYVEEINGNIQVIRCWTPEQIETYSINTDNKELTGYALEANGLGEIPAVIAYNGRSIVRGVGISAINDIADAQRFIYNCISEANDSIRLDSHPSLVASADTQVGTGAGAIIRPDTTTDPAFKPYVLDFAGASIDNIYTAINNTIGAIDKMAAVGSVRATEAKTMSGVAMEVDFQMLNAKLSMMASNLELAEEQMWRLWCKYQGQGYDMCIEYPDSFNIRDSSKEIKELQIAAATNPVDPRTRAAIDMKVLDFLDLDEDELAAINMPDLIDLNAVTEPGDIPEPVTMNPMLSPEAMANMAAKPV
jgi:hypothetical protein